MVRSVASIAMALAVSSIGCAALQLNSKLHGDIDFADDSDAHGNISDAELIFGKIEERDASVHAVQDSTTDVATERPNQLTHRRKKKSPLKKCVSWDEASLKSEKDAWRAEKLARQSRFSEQLVPVQRHLDELEDSEGSFLFAVAVVFFVLTVRAVFIFIISSIWDY